MLFDCKAFVAVCSTVCDPDQFELICGVVREVLACLIDETLPDLELRISRLSPSNQVGLFSLEKPDCEQVQVRCSRGVPCEGL